MVQNSKRRPGNRGPVPATAVDAEILSPPQQARASNHSQRARGGELGRKPSKSTLAGARNALKPPCNGRASRSGNSTHANKRNTQSDQSSPISSNSNYAPNLTQPSRYLSSCTRSYSSAHPRQNTVRQSHQALTPTPIYDPCTNCYLTRGLNLVLRDNLLTSLEKQRRAIEFWADDIGIGNGSTVDEMDWQHEPTMLVRIRDRRLSSMRNIVREADAREAEQARRAATESEAAVQAPLAAARTGHTSSTPYYEGTMTDPRTGQVSTWQPRQEYAGGSNSAIPCPQFGEGTFPISAYSKTTYAPGGHDGALTMPHMPSIPEVSAPSRNPMMEYRNATTQARESCSPESRNSSPASVRRDYQDLPPGTWTSSRTRRNATSGSAAPAGPEISLPQNLSLYHQQRQTLAQHLQHVQSQAPASSRDVMTGPTKEVFPEQAFYQFQRVPCCTEVEDRAF